MGCHTNNTKNTSLVEAKGRVVEVENDLLLVMLDAQGCGRCHEPGGCGGQSLAQLSESTRIYRLPNTIGAKIEDRVCLDIDTNQVRQAAVSAYIFPLALCFTGALLGQWQGGDLFAALGALAGLVAGWLRIRTSRRSANANVEPSHYIQLRFDPDYVNTTVNAD